MKTVLKKIAAFTVMSALAVTALAGCGGSDSSSGSSDTSAADSAAFDSSKQMKVYSITIYY